MKATCCVPDCKSAEMNETELSFHQFPNQRRVNCIKTKIGGYKSVNIRNTWMRRLKIIDVKSTTRVCSLHFQKSDYQKNGLLFPTAIPTLDAQNSTVCENGDEGSKEMLNGRNAFFDRQLEAVLESRVDNLEPFHDHSYADIECKHRYREEYSRPAGPSIRVRDEAALKGHRTEGYYFDEVDRDKLDTEAEKSNGDPLYIKVEEIFSASNSFDTEEDDGIAPFEVIAEQQNEPVVKKRKSDDDQQSKTCIPGDSFMPTEDAKTEEVKDESYLFCELLRLKLRSFDDDTRELAMYKINNMMFELKMSGQGKKT